MMELLVAKFHKTIPFISFENMKRPPGLELMSTNAFMVNSPLHVNSGSGVEG